MTDEHHGNHDEANGDGHTPDEPDPGQPAGGAVARRSPGPTRRRVLAGLAAVGGVAATGCAGGDESAVTPTPMSLGGGKQCDVCGMVIAEHPGPSAMTYFADEGPAGHDGPAWFDSVKERFVYVLAEERSGREPTATYVTDYSAVDYEVVEEGDRQLISRHVAPGSFAPASAVTYVAGSDVHGAMGVELLPFSSTADAEGFRDDHGGFLVDHASVDRDTLEVLRGRD